MTRKLCVFKTICQDFTKELGFNEVKQILVVGPSGRYYIIDGDDGIRSLQFLICGQFKSINYFVVDESYLTVFTQNILHRTETYDVDVDVASDYENSLGEYEFDESDIEYNSKELEVFSKQEGGQ